MGFEPTTSTLARLRSTTELHPRLHYHVRHGSGVIILIPARDASLFLWKIHIYGKKSILACVQQGIW